jgi:hypothetical protein
MASEILRRARKRRLRRGAAATEGVIIATFFVFMFACMWGALTFHHEKIRVMREARAQAWMYALNACSGGGGTTVAGGDDVLGDVASNAGNAGSSSPPDTDNEYANVGDSQLTEDSGYAWVQVDGSVTMPGLIGGTSYQPAGKMYLRCNEDPPPDNLLDIAKKAIKTLAGIFGF